jgi:hypothetical protein
MIQRTSCVLAMAALVATLAGCGGGGSSQTAETATDSLLAANPVEEPQGDITPQTGFEEPKEEPEPAPPPKKPVAKPKQPPAPPPIAEAPGVKVPAGTPVKLKMSVEVDSKVAQRGDTWTGVVSEPVVLGTSAPIPAGSQVQGVVVGAEAAEKGNRAFLALAVTSVTVNGKTQNFPAHTDSIIAGSPRARNLGAVAGGAAAGALIGKAVGGGKGALIGGIVGGAAATAGVAASKGYQVVLKKDTEITFYASEAIVMKN